MRTLRHGYTNDSRTDGSVVVKRYVGPLAAERRATERAALAGLPAGLPVPRVLAEPAGALVLSHLPGVPGQELVDAGHAAPVLHSCGLMLRRLQESGLLDRLQESRLLRRLQESGLVLRRLQESGSGPVLVHGDFGPNNMLFDPDSFAVTGLVDWEWAHRGQPVEDLAWCEWIIRMHHPAAVGALGQLFAGYGERPPWADRQAAMLQRCRQLVEVVGAEAPARLWRDRTELTGSWTEQAERTERMEQAERTERTERTE